MSFGHVYKMFTIELLKIIIFLYFIIFLSIFKIFYKKSIFLKNMHYYPFLVFET